VKRERKEGKSPKKGKRALQRYYLFSTEGRKEEEGRIKEGEKKDTSDFLCQLVRERRKRGERKKGGGEVTRGGFPLFYGKKEDFLRSASSFYYFSATSSVV